MSIRKEILHQLLSTTYRYWIPATQDWSTEKTVKLGGYAIGGLYLLGFVVVTLHLSRTGIVIMDFLRVQYVLAGFWCILPLLASLSLCLLVLRFLFHATDVEHGITVTDAVMLHIFLLIALSVMFTYPLTLVVTKSNMNYSKYLLLPLGISIFAVLATVPLFLLYNPRKKSQTVTDWPYLNSILRKGVAVLTIACVILWLYDFSLSVFDKIPRSLGGGKPITVRIASGESSVLLPLGVPDIGGSNHSTICLLVFETEGIVYVLPPIDIEPNATSTQKLLAISRDQLLGIQYLETTELLTH